MCERTNGIVYDIAINQLQIPIVVNLVGKLVGVAVQRETAEQHEQILTYNLMT